MESTLPHEPPAAWSIRSILGVFKLRIGFVITFTALAGLAVTSGPNLDGWQFVALCYAVAVSSACAGAFNQYYEYDIDPLMSRTKKRAFATGKFQRSPIWLVVIGALLVTSVAAAWLALNAWTAIYTFLGAFFYAIVYTVWLKRRTWLNIVIGGLAGSWAVLAGAAAVGAQNDPVPLALAFVLFLWTPPHFWSLAVAFRDDYAAAGVPILPVVVGDERAAKVIFASTLLLVAASFLPAVVGLGTTYVAGAAVGGLFFILKAWQLSRNPNRQTAMACFHASLFQLTLLLIAAIVDARF